MTKITYEKKSEDVSSGQKNRIKRWTPKVRTGCINCRQRRIKCDEEKPQCLRCQGRHTRCEYQIPSARIFEYDPLERKCIRTKPGHDDATVYRQPGWGDFTKEEQRSISFYLQRTGKMVSKYNLSRYEFWTQILPSAAYQCPALKHCLTALALQDELITSPTAPDTIEQRIAHHRSAAIKLTINETRTLAVLLMCLASFYLETLRENDAAMFVHLESARKIIDAEKIARTKSDSIVSKHLSPIVDECRIYAFTLPSLPIDHPIDWAALPSSTLTFSLDQAEYELSACVVNLCRPAGQVPLALVRANAFLQQWRRDFVSVGEPFAAREKSVLALWNMGNSLIAATQALSSGQADTAFELLTVQRQELQDMDLPAARLEKPLTAVERFVRKYYG